MHATQRGTAKTRIGLALAVVLVSLTVVGPAQAARHSGRYQPVNATAVVAAATTTPMTIRIVRREFTVVSAGARPRCDPCARTADRRKTHR